MLRLYRNDRGQVRRRDRGAGLSVAAGAVRQPSWIDFDGDGDLDLFVAFRDKADALFRNDRGTFTDIAAEVGLADTRERRRSLVRLRRGRRPRRVRRANMDGDANALYQNTAARFTDVAEAAGVEWGGRRRVTRRTAPFARARPTSTTTAVSICSRRTTVRSACS